MLLWLRCIINMRLFATFVFLAFFLSYSSLFPFPKVFLQFCVCSSRQLRIRLVITPMIILSSFANFVVMPDVVFPLPFQHRSTSTFQPLTCVFRILSSHSASLLLTRSRNNPFGLTLKVFFTFYLARKVFLMPHPWIFAVLL